MRLFFEQKEIIAKGDNMSKWMVYCKKADFKAIGDRFGVDQVVARIARNRGNETEQDFDMYFNIR